MAVYFIHPSLTDVEDDVSKKFYNSCCRELEKHIILTKIQTDIVLSSVQFKQDDVIVFFNRSDQNYDQNFISLIQEAKDVQALAIPVSINRDSRTPPEILSKIQSYDFIEELRRRNLKITNLETVAIALARTIISKLQPTLSRDQMNLFISYRRIDGEEIAAAVYKELCARAELAFRDLVSIRVGEDAQEIIEANLTKSDAVIFLDTPKAGESYWIGRELQIALSLNLPIIWVKIGPDDHRVSLRISPADKPHYHLEQLGATDDKINPSLIDEIIQKAFEISREYAKCVFDQLRRLKFVANSNGISLTEVDKRNLIYEIRIPRKGFRYVQRPMTHLIQCYGRVPKEEDMKQFYPSISSLGYNNHPVLGRYHDTSVLLAPIPIQEINSEDDCIIDSFDEYVSCLESFLDPPDLASTVKKGVIISGAFPDCEPEYQQHLTDAIFAFTQAVLDRNGVIIFGGHPTFQHLIFDMAKRRRPIDYVQAIHLYLSKFFVTEAAVKEFEKNATVIATEDIIGNREQSLSVMRKAMIEDDKAACLIALGGKTGNGGHSPGVDEEIALARANDIPIFIIGSVGGRSAEIAYELDRSGWVDKINDLSYQENKELMVSMDFRVIANKILKKIGL